MQNLHAETALEIKKNIALKFNYKKSNETGAGIEASLGHNNRTY